LLIENLRFYLRPYRGQIIGVVTWQLAAALCTALSVGALSPVVSEILGIGTPVAQGAVVAWISRLADLLPFRDDTMNALALLLLATVVAEAMVYGAGLATARLRSAGVRDWMARAYARILHADYRYFVDERHGDIVHLLTVTAYNTHALFEAAGVAAIALQVAALLGLLLSMAGGPAALVVLAAAVAYGGVTYLCRHLVLQWGEEARVTSARQFALADEAMRGARVLKVFDVVDRWREAFRGATRAYTRASVAQEAVRFAPGGLASLGLVGLFGIGAWWASRSGPASLLPSLPAMAVFLYAIRQMTTLLPPATALALSTVGALPHAQTLRQVLQAPRVARRGGSTIFQRLRHGIAFERVTFTHADRARTVSDVSFTAARGQVTAIVGPTGAGKSTLVDLLLGLYELDEGMIRLDGIDLREFDLETWRRCVGVVGQEPFVFNATIAENIALGKPGATMAEIVRAARLADAHEFVTQCAQGYETIVGEGGAKFSGGERQRIALARALLRDPQVLILDEATSALDSRSERSVQHTLRRLRGHTTQIVVSHRLSSIRGANQIVVLRDGRVTEVGAHGVLLRQRGVYYDLYQSQTRPAGQDAAPGSRISPVEV
jgi:ABC-type multidrug transport system fused ATPase/permease subunit